MSQKSYSDIIRKWSRLLHRDISFFFAGILMSGFILFQYEREKQFKIENLNIQLQLLNAQIIDAINNGKSLDKSHFISKTVIPTCASLSSTRPVSYYTTPPTNGKTTPFPTTTPAKRSCKPSTKAKVTRYADDRKTKKATTSTPPHVSALR